MRQRKLRRGKIAQAQLEGKCFILKFLYFLYLLYFLNPITSFPMRLFYFLGATPAGFRTTSS